MVMLEGSLRNSSLLLANRQMSREHCPCVDSKLSRRCAEALENLKFIEFKSGQTKESWRIVEKAMEQL